MYKQLRRSAILVVALVLATVCALTQVGLAQQPPPPAPAAAAGGGGPRKHLATIVFAGLGGAVLGLSTLSFYGRPQEKLSNIAIGFAFGIMAGTALVTYKAATAPEEFYGLRPQIEPEPLVRTARETKYQLLSYQFQF